MVNFIKSHIYCVISDDTLHVIIKLLIKRGEENLEISSIIFIAQVG